MGSVIDKDVRVSQKEDLFSNESGVQMGQMVGFGEGKHEKKIRRKNGTGVTQRAILDLIESQGYRCHLTGWGLDASDASLDHRTPISRGGAHSIDNCSIIHREVNRAKGTMTEEESIAMCRAVATTADTRGIS